MPAKVLLLNIAFIGSLIFALMVGVVGLSCLFDQPAFGGFLCIMSCFCLVCIAWCASDLGLLHQNRRPVQKC